MNTQKKVYQTPQINEIKIDYEISLALESPPIDPFSSNVYEHLINEPYNTNVVWTTVLNASN